MKNKFFRKIAVASAGVGLIAAVPFMTGLCSTQAPTHQKTLVNAPTLAKTNDDQDYYNFRGGTAENRDYTIGITAAETKGMLNDMNNNQKTNFLQWVIHNTQKGEDMNSDMCVYNDDGSFQSAVTGSGFDIDGLYKEVQNAVSASTGMLLHFHCEYEFLAHNGYSADFGEYSAGSNYVFDGGAGANRNYYATLGIQETQELASQLQGKTGEQVFSVVTNYLLNSKATGQTWTFRTRMIDNMQKYNDHGDFINFLNDAKAIGFKMQAFVKQVKLNAVSKTGIRLLFHCQYSIGINQYNITFS